MHKTEILFILLLSYGSSFLPNQMLLLLGRRCRRRHRRTIHINGHIYLVLLNNSFSLCSIPIRSHIHKCYTHTCKHLQSHERTTMKRGRRRQKSNTLIRTVCDRMCGRKKILLSSQQELTQYRFSWI